MKNNSIRVFLGGDVFGPVGMRCARALLPAFLERESVDFCVVNGENATAGIGLSPEDADLLAAAGANAVTGGNHSFEKRDFWPLLDSNPAVLRPANFPASGVPGRGFGTYRASGFSFTVVNLQGREDMGALDCPFAAADSILASLEPDTIVIVDFHAESNEEKEALGLYLDGRAAVVAGTHTHVQTADCRLLPKGTAYITDLGMTGPVRSVIGSDPETAVKRNVTQVLYRMELPDVPGALRGLLVDIDPKTRLASAVERIEIPETF